MKTTTRPTADLTFDPANARAHPERNLEAIKASLRRFGQQKPIVITAEGMVVAGNGTLEAARALGWESIECVETDLEGVERTAFGIADNRTSELAEWDDATLGTLLESMVADGVPLDGLGFDEKEVDRLLEGLTEPVEPEEDEPPPDNTAPERVSHGEVWALGEHRLMCGDSTDPEQVECLMGGERAVLCFTSPPYSMRRDYTDDSDLSDWDRLMRGVFGDHLPMQPDGQVLVNLGLTYEDRTLDEYWRGWLDFMRESWRLSGWYVWDQGHGLPGQSFGRFRPSHEFVFHFARERRDPLKTIPKLDENITDAPASGMRLGGEDKKFSSSLDTHRFPDSVIRVQRQCGRVESGQYHPAPFPIAFPRHFIDAWPGLVYEPFSGSGTTLIAAQDAGVPCRAMEIAPRYCDMAVERWERRSGQTAERLT